MSNLLYLVIPLGGSVVGSIILWARHRKPTSMDAGIDQFHKGLEALAPGGSTTPDPTWRRRRRVH